MIHSKAAGIGRIEQAQPRRKACQSGVIPYRMNMGRVEVALVTSRNGSGWTIPKGNIESDMTAAASAAKEAMEEAGVLGPVSRRSLGSYEYQKRGSVRQVLVYAMQVDSVMNKWPEMHQRERRWIATEQAMELICNEGLRACLERFHELSRPRRRSLAA